MPDEPSPQSPLTMIPAPQVGPKSSAVADAGSPGGPFPGSSWSTNALRLAAQDDAEAWRMLVDAYADMLWAAIGEFGLTGTEATSVWQFAWLSLAQRLDEALVHGDVGRWLLVTVAGEASRVRLRCWVPVPPRSRPSFVLVPSAGCDVGA